MADQDSQKDGKPAEKTDIFLAIKNNPIPALSLSLAITLTAIGMLNGIFNAWSDSLANILILAIILLILPVALGIGVLLAISNTKSYERVVRKKSTIVVIYAILLLLCCSLAYVCVPKGDSVSANASVTPTVKVTVSPTQSSTSAQTPTATPSSGADSACRATISLKSGGTIGNATVEFGPRGWDTYVTTSFEYTDDLDVIAQATYGPTSGRFLQLTGVKRIDFLDLTAEEQKVIDANSAYRDHIRKVSVTNDNGQVTSNIYLLEYAYYDTDNEHGSIQDLSIASIVYD